MKRSSFFTLASLLILIGLAALTLRPSEPSPPVSQFTGLTMGTTFTVTLAGDIDAATLDAIKQEAFAVLEDINQKMSTYLPSSEVSRFNDEQTTEWMPVSTATAEVVDLALRIGAETAGAFDITVGPLVDLWGFGPVSRPDLVPAPSDIDRLLAITGYEKVECRLAPPMLRKVDPRLRIDLSAIAKGYAADRVAARLLSRGLRDFIVEVGGEVVVRGAKGPQTPWRIGIESPLSDRREIGDVLSLRDMAMATSGDYRNYFEDNGRRYSHTIDPRTGYPIDHALAAVTILDPSCARADALATAFMVLGPDQAFSLAEKANIAALLIVKTPSGFVEKRSKAFQAKAPQSL